MAKAKKETKPRAGKYEEKLSIKAGFMDVINATVRDAERNAASKRKGA